LQRGRSERILDRWNEWVPWGRVGALTETWPEMERAGKEESLPRIATAPSRKPDLG